ncbi:23S rRNA (adenine(2503)-C(2))-methyltransferase [candidate division WOR-1 bacterium RIFOXYC2_FULL_41_25]|uniref:Probable dual-specificity RNA methyltransferase RlmN n=1 Tax=candidate division WOR-1 bacterium RIFOXYC2_FULL_41_25 TaxID=1802586 RepID=A0A1F4TRL7_UNCSA|nr:MAG: 23S rRNA (adenine(2503)-C(2))-methyltransferase [Bdellovibrionales bacterium RIFOXYB1_FULL_39_21]OFZ41853.1 MAG: 23S rRNA (adenine(2503)-C(2))-methyltransferase [Bdellovibrionales bacterium RIFOXYC12_FULL_39_17]OFZ50569.1 MAG: 23S rRNA (adenine(2503)-C(2))-methyltransferase [Bdellovibrionales bacterium RIFOXYC1_FULL_39_130]OFZ77792.1 MAG: 23S rRNA (adenine(2503)-C(2))-methyltransferase [Bdellovibrionales bacterium RIFOXYD1_FULL_39_84]OFZ93772.1 MAG: 23S rRNA (adenine(2503)-C(2))-methylt
MSLIDKMLYSLTLSQLNEILMAHGFKKYVSEQVFKWLYRQCNFEITSWSNISLAAKNFLQENFSIALPQILRVDHSSDGTKKFLLSLADGEQVETVYIPFNEERHTICVSSQVGCPMGCIFCLTGQMGFKRNLFAGEIIAQYLAVTFWMRTNVASDFKLTNMVFMGQGEPLLNFDNVKSAIEILVDSRGIALGQRKITLSTSGWVPQIKKLNDFPPVNIAISLHAVDDVVRSKLMPINNRYDIHALFDAIKEVHLKAHRRITYEYLLIEDVNDRPEDIDGLTQLISKRDSKINIIPFNDYPESPFRRPTDAKIIWFQEELLKRGLVTTIRASKGKDILAACGQLKNEFSKS